MASQAKGKLVVLAWVDGGVLKPVVLDTGAIPVTETDPLTAIDVTLAASDITLGVTESSPLTELDVTLKASDITLGVTESSPLTELDVTLKASDITLGVTESSPLTTIQAQKYGYVGGAWQKQPIEFGFTYAYSQEIFEANASASQDILVFSVVPAGEVWVITHWLARNITTKPTELYLRVRRPGVDYNVSCLYPSAANIWVGGRCHVVMSVGDFITILFVGTVAGDDLSAIIHGYRMNVDD